MKSLTVSIVFSFINVLSFNNIYLRAGKALGDKVVHTLILQMWKLSPRKGT